jgi:hypothetical protein
MTVKWSAIYSGHYGQLCDKANIFTAPKKVKRLLWILFPKRRAKRRQFRFLVEIKSLVRRVAWECDHFVDRRHSLSVARIHQQSVRSIEAEMIKSQPIPFHFETCRLKPSTK